MFSSSSIKRELLAMLWQIDIGLLFFSRHNPGFTRLSKSNCKGLLKGYDLLSNLRQYHQKCSSLAVNSLTNSNGNIDMKYLQERIDPWCSTRSTQHRIQSFKICQITSISMFGNTSIDVSTVLSRIQVAKVIFVIMSISRRGNYRAVISHIFDR